VIKKAAVPVAARSKAWFCGRSPAEMWFRIPPGARVSVYFDCCVLSGRSLCVGLITRPEESYRLWCVVVCDLEISLMRWPWPTGGCCGKRKPCKQSRIISVCSKKACRGSGAKFPFILNLALVAAATLERSPQAPIG
jgi:hypothetical protein